MLVELTEREANVIRDALRMAESSHKRNDFKALVLEAQGLRSKISNAIIDQAVSNKTTASNAV